MRDDNIDGGPAFPCGRDVTLDQFAPCLGLSQRDYFAAKAMQGLLASGEADKICVQSDSDWPDAIASNAFSMADAMLKARTA